MNRLRQVLLRPRPSEEDALLSEIREVCGKLEAAQNRFSMEQDGDLIEALIYETVSLEARYRYLLRLARERGVKAGHTAMSPVVR